MVINAYLQLPTLMVYSQSLRDYPEERGGRGLLAFTGWSLITSNVSVREPGRRNVLMERKLTNRLNRLWYSPNFRPIPAHCCSRSTTPSSVQIYSTCRGDFDPREGSFFLFNGEKVTMILFNPPFRMPELI